MEKKIVDARGLACPLPVVRTKEAVNSFKGQGGVTVLVDNEIAVQNLQKFAAQRGLSFSGEKKAEKEYEVTIQVFLHTLAAEEASGAQAAFMPSNGDGKAFKSGDKAEFDNKESDGAVCSPDARKKGMVVALSSNAMGTGEEKLGKSLMKAFIFALTKQDALPETILCYNSGAYLTCEGFDSLEDFKALEAEGVNVLTCGTCLDFYGIKEKLSVGTVTNMYEIVERMEQAGTVLRP